MEKEPVSVSDPGLYRKRDGLPICKEDDIKQAGSA